MDILPELTVCDFYDSWEISYVKDDAFVDSGYVSDRHLGFRISDLSSWSSSALNGKCCHISKHV